MKLIKSNHIQNTPIQNSNHSYYVVFNEIMIGIGRWKNDKQYFRITYNTIQLKHYIEDNKISFTIKDHDMCIFPQYIKEI